MKDDYKWKILKCKFKWDNRKKEIFSGNLLANQNVINEICQRIEAGLIERSGEMVQELFLNAALNTLEQKNLNKQKHRMNKRKITKKWFDNECNDLRKDVRRFGREKYRKSDDSLLREEYHEKLKEYKNKCKSKRNNFWQNTLMEVEKSLGDPNSFWKKWKNVNECAFSTQPLYGHTEYRWGKMVRFFKKSSY